MQLLDSSNTIAIQVDLNGIAGVGDDTWYHYTLNFDCTPDTYDHYLDGTSIAAGVAFTNGVASIATIKFIGTDADSGYYNYIDAIGCSWDTDYVNGDNIFWRGLTDKMTEANLEGEDLYTSSTDIEFVDSDTIPANCSLEISPEFSEHKKIIKLLDGNGALAASFDHSLSDIEYGTIEWYMKVSDATNWSGLYVYHGGNLIVRIVSSSEYWKTDNGNMAAATDATWAHFKFEFECTGGGYQGLAQYKCNIWIDNILRESSLAFLNNEAHIDKLTFTTATVTTNTLSLDALGFSWESDYTEADNRVFEYHTHSKIDITDKVFEGFLEKSNTTYSVVSLETSETLDDEHLLMYYDENSDLRFIGNHFKDVDLNSNSINGYIYHDLNKTELLDETTYTASSAEDVNASLLGIITNVDQTEGRLIYYTVDDPSGNLTPNYRNKPIQMLIRLLAIRGGKKAIIKGNGKVFLDDDANPDNGAVTITGSSIKLMDVPLIDKTSHQINYVEVRGAIDPNTGTRFSGISQDTDAQGDGTGIIPYYKSYRELQSDTDCENMAIAIRTDTGFTPKIITVPLRSVYADPGEIINFAYADKSFSATNCYVDYCRLNIITGVGNYVLNTGIIDPITFNAPGYTEADETADDIAETLYETDTNTIVLKLYPYATASYEVYGVLCPALNDAAYAHFYIDNYIDTDRDIILTFIFTNGANGALTFDGEIDIYKYNCTGGTGGAAIESNLNFDVVFTGDLGRETKDYTLSASDLASDKLLMINWSNKEGAKDIYVSGIQAHYYVKRSI